MHTRIIVLLLAWGLASGCELLPKDFWDPKHAYYVESGEKATDRARWQAMFMFCVVMVEPVVQQDYQDCLAANPKSVCLPREPMGVLHFDIARACAYALANLHPGARKQEFDRVDLPM
jgi:hypothetical protein